MGIEVINIKEKINQIANLYEYHKVADFNDHMINLIKTEVRTLDFHTHEDSDEIFWVMEGEMQLEFESGLKKLTPGEMIVVPKGVLHRPVCDKPCTLLLIEKKGTLTPDNTGGAYKN